MIIAGLPVRVRGSAPGWGDSRSFQMILIFYFVKYQYSGKIQNSGLNATPCRLLFTAMM